VVKHILDYSAICCRQFMQCDRRAHIWRCSECQFPKCKLCDARPEVPVSPNHVSEDGSWYCLTHRYPPCHVCRLTPRPPSGMHSKMRFRDWTCGTCKANLMRCKDWTCATCKANEMLSPPPVARGDGRRKPRTCDGCGSERALTEFSKEKKAAYDRHKKTICKLCEKPPCAVCGHRAKSKVAQSDKIAGQWWCPNPPCQAAKACAQGAHPCTVCGQCKEKEAFHSSPRLTHQRKLSDVCDACAFPTCCLCGTKHADSDAPLRKNARGRVGERWYCDPCAFPTCNHCGRKHSETKRQRSVLPHDAPGRLTGQWFCDKPACQAALRQTASGSVANSSSDLGSSSGSGSAGI